MDYSLLTDGEAQRIIIDECKIDGDPKGANLLGLYWKASAKYTGNRRVLEVKAGILRYLVGKLREDIDTTVGPDRFALEQRWKHAYRMLLDAEAAITDDKGEGRLGTLSSGGAYLTQEYGPVTVSREELDQIGYSHVK